MTVDQTFFALCLCRLVMMTFSQKFGAISCNGTTCYERCTVLDANVCGAKCPESIESHSCADICLGKPDDTAECEVETEAAINETASITTSIDAIVVTAEYREGLAAVRRLYVFEEPMIYEEILFDKKSLVLAAASPLFVDDETVADLRCAYYVVANNTVTTGHLSLAQFLAKDSGVSHEVVHSPASTAKCVDSVARIIATLLMHAKLPKNTLKPEPKTR